MNITTTSLVPFFLLVFIAAASAQSVSRASYGENCSKEIRCESRKFLFCSNGQCNCLMQDTMVFDEEAEKCVTLAGERCQYNTVEGESTWTEEVPCISNAQCLNGLCECGSNYFEISNGTCQLKRKHGEDCVTNEMCESSKHLYCGNEQKCTCGPDRILSNDKCVVRAGKICRNGEDECVEHSTCLQTTGEANSTCTCSKTHYQTSEGTCKKKGALRDKCSEDSHCLDIVYHPTNQAEIQSFLVCVQGSCECNRRLAVEDPENSYRFCGKQLDQLCRENECFTGAHCSDGTCQCESENFFETGDKTCEARRAYDEPCKQDADCKTDYRCTTNKRCGCPDGKSFTPSSNQCVVSADYTCRANSYSGTEFSCVPNSECQRQGQNYRYDYDSYPWKCKCIQDTVKGEGGYCYVKGNGTCKGDRFGPITTELCTPGLACRDGICTCPYKDHQLFIEDRKQCLTLVGGPCNATENCLDRNAECTTLEGTEINQCLCKKGFTQVGRGCDISYGEKCEQGGRNTRCDRYGPLECSSRKVCECSDFQMYDKNALICKGLVGAKCKLTNGGNGAQVNDFCVGDSTCRPFRGVKREFGLCLCPHGYKTEMNRTCTLPSPPVVTSTLKEIVKPLLEIDSPQADEVPNNELDAENV